MTGLNDAESELKVSMCVENIPEDLKHEENCLIRAKMGADGFNGHSCNIASAGCRPQNGALGMVQEAIRMPRWIVLQGVFSQCGYFDCECILEDQNGPRSAPTALRSSNNVTLLINHSSEH